jgi:hypothetical protein
MLAILIIGLTASAVVWNVTRPEQVAAQTAPDQASTIAWSETPAAKAIDKTFSSLPATWTPRGNQLKSVTPPFPLSCMTEGLQPSYSVSQQFNNGLTVAVSSFTAGAGAVAMDAQVKDSGKCVQNNTYVSNAAVSGIGTQATTISVRRGGATSQTTVFRRGDIIAYVLSDGGASGDAAKAVDGVLQAALAGQCIDESSKPADASRSLWGGVTFTGWQKSTDVTIPRRAVPAVTDKTQYVATAIPADIQPVVEYEQPEKPSYPVWPLMPTVVPTPTLPAAPNVDPPMKSTVDIRVPDEKGPGCGWDFTGTVSPAYDNASIESANNDLKVKAVAELTKNADAWSASVTAYWKEISAYRKAAEAYAKYRDESVAVAAKWEPIAKLWDTYNANLAIYNNAVTEREQFIAKQASASKSYDEEVKRCNAPEPSPSPTPTPSSSPTTAPSPSATPTPSPTPTATMAPMSSKTVMMPSVRSGCPANRPEILDQTPPELPTKPVEPPNPIPADKR